MKIAFLDPVPSAFGLPVFAQELRQYICPHTEIDYVTLDTNGTDNYEFEVYEAYMSPQILDRVRGLEEEGYDAVILGCFYDPAIVPARELCTKMVVVGAAQASISLAKLICKRYSLLIPRDKNYTHMREMVERNHGIDALASIRMLNLKVMEIQEDETFRDSRMEEEITAAVHEDLAEAIVLACTMEVGTFLKLQEKYGIPIIDPVIAGLKTAEYLVECRDSCGWYTSKRGTYETPSKEEMKSFGLCFSTKEKSMSI